MRDYNDLRVSVCKKTKTLVVQLRDLGQPDGWLCLHNDTIEEDLSDVKAFREEILPKYINPHLKAYYQENSNDLENYYRGVAEDEILER